MKRTGFDQHFDPTCVREHSYRYDSYDKRYKTLKFVRPKACKDRPLAYDSLCQKVYKIKVETNLRKYTAPARGTKTWEGLYDQRMAVERVNAYLKEFFQLKIDQSVLGVLKQNTIADLAEGIHNADPFC